MPIYANITCAHRRVPGNFILFKALFRIRLVVALKRNASLNFITITPPFREKSCARNGLMALAFSYNSSAVLWKILFHSIALPLQILSEKWIFNPPALQKFEKDCAPHHDPICAPWKVI